MTSIALSVLILVALATSTASLNTVILVTRIIDGDIFELQPGKQCNADAVPFVPPNNNNNPPTKSFCKCKPMHSTLMFDYDYHAECYNVDDLGNMPMFFLLLCIIR